MRNLGLDILREERESSPADYIFGAGSQDCLVKIPLQEREQYLPKGERQFGREDFMDCATRSPINLLAEKFTYAYKNGLLSLENRKWLEKKGYVTPWGVDFSDRYIAILSETTRSGNSLKAPIEAIRKNGLIPKPMLSASEDMTFDQYHTGVTEKMKALGQEFLQRFTINYEKVYDYFAGSNADLLSTAGYAWVMPIDGVYPKSDLPMNHAFMIFKPLYFAFDNYENMGIKDDWIKQLAPDYNFYKYGYRLYISENIVTQKITIIKKLINLYKQVIALLTKQIEEEKKTLPEPKYLWGNPTEVRHSIRVIGDELNMSWTEKDLACDICRCESGFIPTARLENGPGSIDRGLFQINSFFHSGMTDEMAYDPEQNTRWALQAILDGKAIAYWRASSHCWNKNNKYLV